MEDSPSILHLLYLVYFFVRDSGVEMSFVFTLGRFGHLVYRHKPANDNEVRLPAGSSGEEG